MAIIELDEGMLEDLETIIFVFNDGSTLNYYKSIKSEVDKFEILIRSEDRFGKTI